MKALLILTFFCIQSTIVLSQDILKGTATNIYDGDTFTLVAEDGTKSKIRIVGIDAPEKNQDFGIKSRDYARSILQDKKLTVYLEPGETYGRKLGIVITDDGLHFNYEMVANGYAWWYDAYSKDKYLEAAFEKAKSNKIGLWATTDPQAPWQWRRENEN